ncbi:hypothetical protein FQR65_LT15789 [Abscondita terminalis]|nr:hypothetical protein FQR65_LT15789 [Abscondita terminalis]
MKRLFRRFISILEDECKDYEIVVAEDGLEGFKLIEKDDFSLIISDIKMPKMTGNELLVKALEIKPDTTFVMISGHADIDTAVKCLKDGAYDFISKPIDINRLITSVIADEQGNSKKFGADAIEALKTITGSGNIRDTKRMLLKD